MSKVAETKQQIVELDLHMQLLSSQVSTLNKQLRELHDTRAIMENSVKLYQQFCPHSNELYEKDWDMVVCADCDKPLR